MLFFRAFLDQGLADRLACGIAPMLPLLPPMPGLGFIARRLAGGNSWFLAALAPFAAQVGISMFLPMRIDHHGWHLAITVLLLAGVVDRTCLRGGTVAGVRRAAYLATGTEMMCYM